MTWREFNAWLRIAPDLVAWQQGKGELPGDEMGKVDLSRFGL